MTIDDDMTRTTAVTFMTLCAAAAAFMTTVAMVCSVMTHAGTTPRPATALPARLRRQGCPVWRNHAIWDVTS